jgi:hypothetical protein
MRWLAASVFVLSLAACDKATVQECDKGCRNYFELHYWQAADMEIARAPAEQRDELRQQKQAELEPRMMKNLDLCVQKCKSGSDSKRAKCWAAARTTAEAKACEND